MSKTFSLVSALALTLMFSTAQAVSQSVTETATIAASPADVWETAKNFNDIASWHPAIVSQTTTNGNQPGSVRVADLGGPTITEELIRFNEKHKNFTYKINKVNPAILPVKNYIAWFSVQDNGQGGSTITWIGHFDLVGDAKAADVEKGVRGIYRAGIDSLKATLEANTQ